MTMRFDARLDAMLDTLCALAEALPADARHAARFRLAQRVAARCPASEEADVAVAGDVARILNVLGCLPRAHDCHATTRPALAMASAT